jgi:hypothetical protein
MMMRYSLPLVILAALQSPSFGQVNLTEAPKAGDLSRYSIELHVSGRLIVGEAGKRQEIKLDAKARHAFAEKTLAAADGLPLRSVRYYGEAAATVLVGSDIEKHALPADRKLVVASRTADGLSCYCPSGPLTREELDLVSEHFDPHCLAGLLPGKAVAVGDTWIVGNAAAQAACLFDGLIKNSLAGKLIQVKDGVAGFAITGTTEGLENGAKVSLAIDAAGKFDAASNRVIELVWKQADDREQGPASPASKLEATVLLKREALPEAPKEFADAALAGLAIEPPGHLTRLHFVDSKGRYRFDYPRDWHVTGQTDDHLVLRLLDRGEFIAQATITWWKKADPGKHAAVNDFKKAVGDSPGWISTRILEEGEIPIDGGRWLYRLQAEGKMEEQPAVQAFHLLAGSNGDQVAVTLSMKPERMKALGGRGISLVKAIEFGRK